MTKRDRDIKQLILELMQQTLFNLFDPLDPQMGWVSLTPVFAMSTYFAANMPKSVPYTISSGADF
jgi:hypothetical protein